MIDRHSVIIGRGHVTTAAGQTLRLVNVRVTFTALGRSLTARPGGVRITFTAVVTVRGRTGSISTHASSTVLATTFTLVRSVRFTTDSHTVGAADAAYLRSVRGKLGTAKIITCVGHADSRGSAKAALTLGSKRAAAACAIIAKGLHAAVHLVSKGEKAPIGKNNTPAGRARNRRVDVTITN
jgi:outer membrane protein OmpA-like peptidoglycan-associated protein